MGSGCLQTPISNNCGTFISTNCVKYQGDPYTQFGICTNDTQTEIDKIILDLLTTFSTGDGIVLDINYNCAYLLNKGANKTLTSAVQVSLDSICELKASIEQILTQIASSGNNYTFDMSCVTPLPGTQSLQTVIQAIIFELCDLSAEVDTIVNNNGNTTIINQSINQALLNLITTPGGNGLKKTVAPSGLSSYSITGLTPPRSAIPYFGPTALFDASGKGLVGTAAEGWYLCNGNNGTPDMRGFTIVGAIQGVNGPALNPIVDPVSNGDSSMNYAVGQVGGTAKVALTSNNIPPHTHPVVDPGHDHLMPPSTMYSDVSAEGGIGGSPDWFNTTRFTGKSTTGITIGQNPGNNVPHENRMPYIVCNFIMRFD